MLEFLGEWQLTIPGLGEIKAKYPPFTIVTANDERQLGYPLLRRCARIYINHPTPEQEAAIVASRTPHCAKAIHYFIAGFAKTLRAFKMEKPPSISEMITLALALDKLNLKEISDDHKAVMLPFIAKTEKDRASLLVPGRFESFMDNARIHCERNVPARHSDLGGSDGYRLRNDNIRGHRRTAYPSHAPVDARFWGLSLHDSTLRRTVPMVGVFRFCGCWHVCRKMATMKWSTTPTRTPLTMRFQKSWSTRSSPRSPAGIQERCPQRGPWD